MYATPCALHPGRLTLHLCPVACTPHATPCALHPGRYTLTLRSAPWPYTLHPSRYTLRPAPWPPLTCALQPCHYTLRPAPWTPLTCALHPGRYTLHPGQRSPAVDSGPRMSPTGTRAARQRPPPRRQNTWAGWWWWWHGLHIHGGFIETQIKYVFSHGFKGSRSQWRATDYGVLPGFWGFRVLGFWGFRVLGFC